MKEVTVSVRIYRMLLRLYPRGFRAEYEQDLLQAFVNRQRERCAGAKRDRHLRFWAEILDDLVRSAPREHMRELRRPRAGSNRVKKGDGWMGSRLQDVRHAVRLLGRDPFWTLILVLTLAVGMAASTAMFSVVDGVLLRPLPFPDADRLVQLGMAFDGPPAQTSIPEFIDLREQVTLVERISMAQRQSIVIGGDGPPERSRAFGVSAGFFETLGAAPAMGRAFTREEHRTRQNDVVILSHGLWRRRFGGDPDIIGRVLRTGEDASGAFTPLTVIGVMPREFRAPEATLAHVAELWLPMATDEQAFAEEGRGSRSSMVIGRLAEGATVVAARHELDGLTARLREMYPDYYGFRERQVGMGVVPLLEATVGDSRAALLVLLASSGLLLLIACANAANLMLARTTERGRELSVRSALGAGRGRLLSQLLTESLVVAGLGGAVGTAGAYGLVWALDLFGPTNLARLGSVGVDLRALSFAAGLTLLTGVVFGLAPAVLGSSRHTSEQLKDGARGSSASRGLRRLRSGVVVGETAVALMLLVGAGLLINSHLALQRVDQGFDGEGLSMLQVGLRDGAYEASAERVRLYQALTERVAAVPGVTSVSTIADPPLIGYSMWLPSVIRTDIAEEEHPVATAHIVDRGYFRTVGLGVIQGRDFSPDDVASSPLVVVVGETMAQELWPGQNPLGKRFRTWEGGPERSVIGVVSDMRHDGPGVSERSRFYAPLAQESWFAWMNLVIRTAPGRTVPAEEIRAVLRDLDPTIPFDGIVTVEERMASLFRTRDFNTLLLTGFAAVALLLAAGGLYGTLRYAVEQRRREVGIRVALGGEPSHVIRLLLGQGVRLALAGVGVGVLGALLVSRLLRSMLFGVEPTDPATFAAVSGLLLAVALLASWVPARKAARISPVEALRSE